MKYNCFLKMAAACGSSRDRIPAPAKAAFVGAVDGVRGGGRGPELPYNSIRDFQDSADGWPQSREPGRPNRRKGGGDHYAFEIRRLGRVQNPDYRAEPILVFSLWFHVVMSGPWLAAWEAHLNYRLGRQADRVKWLIVLSKKAVNGGEGRGTGF